MFHKIFQVVLITFVVIFTAAAAVLLVSGISSLLLSIAGTGGSIFIFAGGVGRGTLEVGVIILLLFVAGVFLVARRSRLR